MKNLRMEIARRIRRAGYKKAAQEFLELTKEMRFVCFRLGDAFLFSETPQGNDYWESIADHLDWLGWEGGWRRITGPDGKPL